MRLGSYSYLGRASYGIFTELGVVDLASALKETAPTLADLLRVGCALARPLAEAPSSYIPVADIRFERVIPNPAKVISIGLNTKSHFAEASALMGIKDPPSKPWFFLRSADSLVGHRNAIIRPKVSQALDYEGEIALIIGRRARYVSVADALDHVAGFTCANEGSVRDYQRHSGLGTAGKVFPKSGALGPWLLTRDEAPAVNELEITLCVNGEQRQRMTMDDLIFSPAQLVSYLSECMCLEPGDVIMTGSPAGVGAIHEPPTWLRPGDIVEIELSGVGVLQNTVEDESF